MKSNIRVSQKSCNILVGASLQRNIVEVLKATSVVGSIMIDGALTHCALLHRVCDMKVTQVNVQRSIIRERVLYAAAEAIKNICCCA